MMLPVPDKDRVELGRVLIKFLSLLRPTLRLDGHFVHLVRRWHDKQQVSLAMAPGL